MLTLTRHNFDWLYARTNTNATARKVGEDLARLMQTDSSKQAPGWTDGFEALADSHQFASRLWGVLVNARPLTMKAIRGELPELDRCDSPKTRYAASGRFVADESKNSTKHSVG